jgi:ABC-type transport system involved in multi-copper enzyme maturation permease subunit
MNVVLIAGLTLREASRRRLILSAGLIVLGFVALTAWGFHALATARDPQGRELPHYALMATSGILVILMAFMFSVVLSLGAAFLGALSIGAEIENGTLLAIVPRPLRRAEIAIGKWLGNAFLIGGFAAAIAGLEFAVVHVTTGYTPPQPAVAVVYLIAQSAIVLTLTMSLSVRLPAIAAGITTIALFGVAWLGGVVGAVASALQNEAVHQAAVVVSLLIPTDGVWRGAVFALEPAAIGASAANPQQANPFATGAPPTTAYLIWCAVWFLAMAYGGIAAFRRRDV